MEHDLSQIQLSDTERQMLAEIAQRTGRSWTEVLRDALQRYNQSAVSIPANGTCQESWFHRLAQHGLVGCLHGGPSDLSTNPKHMEGFGESDQ